jgi:hypothetical protein
MPRPKPVIGGDMKDPLTTPYRTIKRSRIPQIANHRLNFQFPQPASGPNQRPYVLATLGQQPRDMPPDETGSAGNQRGLHRLTPRRRSEHA